MHVMGVFTKMITCVHVTVGKLDKLQEVDSRIRANKILVIKIRTVLVYK